MRQVKTFTATIFIGTRVGRTNDPAPSWYPLDQIKKTCAEYCNEVGLCVTVTPTEFIYTKGSEPGAAVGLINYPRFPELASDIKEIAIKLARLLKASMKQRAVSIVFPDETVMLDDEVNT